MKTSMQIKSVARHRFQMPDTGLFRLAVLIQQQALATRCFVNIGSAVRAAIRCLAVVVLLLTTSTAFADEQLLQRLNAFSSTLQTFTADFQQTVYDADSNPTQESSGSVMLKRPGRFIWNYSAPSKQQIIADGKSIWLYDLELEQVTVNALSDQASGTPLTLLMGDRPLDQEFEIRVLGASDGIDWVELKPHSNESDFELVYLGLIGDDLAAMELRDNFGQATQIRFTNFKSGIPLDDELFMFVAPPGVDVIGQG